MSQEIDLVQVQAVLDFFLFLNDVLSQTSHQFEHETSCSPDEANVLRLVKEHGSLMVKDIAQSLPAMDPSKLTRLIDSLEKQAYITRTINPSDRRSFLITPTSRGLQILEIFVKDLQGLTQTMLSPLTPVERLMLVELFRKIQGNSNLMPSVKP
jgi:DNA-binding MarR family transcriptional regulator